MSEGKKGEQSYKQMICKSFPKKNRLLDPDFH